MPKKKPPFKPQLVWAEAGSSGNTTIPYDPTADIPATPKEPAKAFDPAQVPTFIQSLKSALSPKGRWSTKKPEWVRELLLYTIDGLAATIQMLVRQLETTREAASTKPKRRKTKQHDTL
jgi:hypothetical protein